MKRTKFVKVDKEVFSKMDFKIEVSPFCKRVCCCGYVGCIDSECSIGNETD